MDPADTGFAGAKSYNTQGKGVVAQAMKPRGTNGPSYNIKKSDDEILKNV